MSLWIDIKYAKMAGAHGMFFKVKKETPFLAVQRCPICGDSKKSLKKTRFFFYQKEGKINCACHNCGYSQSIRSFLKLTFPNLYSEYAVESYVGKESGPVITDEEEEIEEVKETILELPQISKLPKDHFARQYVESRKIVNTDSLYYCEKFASYSSQFNKEFRNASDHPRLVIEFKTRKGKTFCYSGRAFGNESPKYQIVALPSYESYPKIFGLERLDTSKPVTLVEGPLDSLFIDNCLAASNASLSAMGTKLVELLNMSSHKELTLVFDNEPRNREVVFQYEKAIKLGFSVVIWPKNILEKDINEMIMSGISAPQIIKENTYSGLMALNEFNSWKKV